MFIEQLSVREQSAQPSHVRRGRIKTIVSVSFRYTEMTRERVLFTVGELVELSSQLSAP